MSEYRVMNMGVGSDKHRRITSHIVSNAPVGWDHYERKWPIVAEFPVAPGYSDEDQYRRACEYRDYMNRTTPVQPPIGEIEPYKCPYCKLEKGHDIGCPGD